MVLWFSLAACLVLHVVALVTTCASEIRWNTVNTCMLQRTSWFRPMLFLDLCREFIVRVKRWGGALADVWSEPELFVYICVVCIFIWGVVPCWPSKLEMAVVDGSEKFRRLMLKVNDIPWLLTSHDLFFFRSECTIMTESSESVQSGQSGVSSVCRFACLKLRHALD